MHRSRSALGGTVVCLLSVDAPACGQSVVPPTKDEPVARIKGSLSDTSPSELTELGVDESELEGLTARFGECVYDAVKDGDALLAEIYASRDVGELPEEVESRTRKCGDQLTEDLARMAAPAADPEPAGGS